MQPIYRTCHASILTTNTHPVAINNGTQHLLSVPETLSDITASSDESDLDILPPIASRLLTDMNSLIVSDDFDVRYEVYVDARSRGTLQNNRCASFVNIFPEKQYKKQLIVALKTSASLPSE